MLRRSEKIVLRDEPAGREDVIPRTLAQRRGLGTLKSEAAEPSPPSDPEPAPMAEDATAQRWREEIAQQPQMSPEHRRNIDRWRAEVLQSVAASDEDEGPTGRWRHLFKPANIALIAVALIAGGTAAFLAMQQGAPPAEAPVIAAAPAPQTITQVVEEPKVQVLVARTAIAVGQRLSPASVEWVESPEDTTRPDFLLQTAAPDALETMSGAVARYEFFPGEPIREIKLARADRGFLSAVLDPGTRGVSVAVSAESASGGFILPNDRVDVVLTTTVGAKQASSTILRNVKVLAINSTIGETAGAKPKSESRNSGDSDKPQGEDAADAVPGTFSSAIATLALAPEQAEVIISATLNGRLSLVLRPTADVAEAADDGVRAANEAIRISSPFWAN
ncbi:Flp pilus assembly protein CpaB [Devosia sp.]|uniref:Flp pilus assembly protein CpaB n=1 Tax=Devosia sp. TaxID=1871048 RepID=UPI001AC59730|nr:Flp pilus assembly protein CpaB [Devosia sp.]MBN9310606.1 Flp pilus assembly protein CpaB [Devosia sp.]